MSEEIKKLAKLQLQSKNMVVGLLLTFFFGGFGLLYVSTTMGIVCSIIELILFAVVIFTIGFGTILLVPAHLGFLALTLISINRHNRKLAESL